MQRHITIIGLALLTALFPHLGFPGYVKVAGTTLLSLGIALIAYMGYRETKNMKALPSVSLPHVSMPNLKRKKKPVPTASVFETHDPHPAQDDPTFTHEETTEDTHTV